MANPLLFQSFGATPSLLTFALSIPLVVLYVIYRWSLPRPIPGIPYNKAAASSPFGDIPAVKKHVRETGEMWTWVSSQIKELNSAIIQIFIRADSTPWVVITDFRESQDILMRRTKEFDRSDQFGNTFTGIVPDHHIHMKSANPEFKAHRRLIQDLMTPAFLNGVCDPL
jgi:hypothetical protein